jgi:hypothetical protein
VIKIRYINKVYGTYVLRTTTECSNNSNSPTFKQDDRINSLFSREFIATICKIIQITGNDMGKMVFITTFFVLTGPGKRKISQDSIKYSLDGNVEVN